MTDVPSLALAHTRRYEALPGVPEHGIDSVVSLAPMCLVETSWQMLRSFVAFRSPDGVAL